MKKKFRSRIVAALVAVTALTCCFVGSTFAKYTSSTDKKATAQVALWEVDGITNAPQTNTFTMTSGEEKFSPELTANAEGKYVNTVTTQNFEITNNSDVAAIITFNIGNAVVQDSTGAALTIPTEHATNVANTFSATLALADGQSLTLNEQATPTTGYAKTYTVELPAKATTATSVQVVLSITWTTVTDATDTWLGMNAASVGVTVNTVATQNSVLPNA